MKEQANFLIIMVDQLSGTFFEGGPASFLHAPTLRNLADRAICFDNAYCASPLCAPSRASFLSGNLPSATGVYDNAAEFPSTLPTFAHRLRVEGYKTILCGKMHFVGADQLHGFEERLTTDIYPADFGWTPNWRRPGERVDWWYHNLGSVSMAGVASTTNQFEFDDEVCYHTKLRLFQLARDTDKKPFCLTVSFTHPHDPYVTRQQYWDLYSEERLPELAVPAIPFEKQDAHSQRLLRAFDFERYPLRDKQIRNARRAYFANVSYLDDKIGEILSALDECGFGNNTIVIFCADHGDMLGERGLWFKMCFFEPSMRVPMMLYSPELPGPRRVPDPVSTLDIASTLYELAGCRTEEYPLETAGRSLLDLADGGSDPDRTILAEYAGEGAVDPMVMIREGRWKFIHCDADPTQLYDLGADPNELDNLADDPSHRDIASRFEDIVGARWDLDGFREHVLRSQACRQLVYRGLRTGEYRPWDFEPTQRASERFMRNHLDLNAVEAGARFPKTASGDS